jgi:uncharacterized protein (DUF433 family)
MEGLDRITIEPGKMGGQPCIRGHRFTVEHLLSLVGASWTLEEIQADSRSSKLPTSSRRRSQP